MPVRRQLTNAERAARRKLGQRTNAFEEHTFYTPEERAELREASAERRAELEAHAANLRAEAAAQRQRVSPQNPTGAPLDPRNGLPEYPRRTVHIERKLTEVSDDFGTAADLIDQKVAEMDDEFAAAFEAEDRRRTIRDRIDRAGASGIYAAAEQRRSRIGG